MYVLLLRSSRRREAGRGEERRRRKVFGNAKLCRDCQKRRFDCQKGPNEGFRERLALVEGLSKETYCSFKGDLLQCQKRPITVSNLHRSLVERVAQG